MEVTRSIPLKSNLMVEKGAGFARAEKIQFVTWVCVALRLRQHEMSSRCRVSCTCLILTVNFRLSPRMWN